MIRLQVIFCHFCGRRDFLYDGMTTPPQWSVRPFPDGDGMVCPSCRAGAWLSGEAPAATNSLDHGSAPLTYQLEFLPEKNEFPGYSPRHVDASDRRIALAFLVGLIFFALLGVFLTYVLPNLTARPPSGELPAVEAEPSDGGSAPPRKREH